MALPVHPPPHPNLPGNTRYPKNLQFPGEPVELRLFAAIDIFGRAGNPPDTDLDDWIRTAINNDPEDDEYGSWAQPTSWMCYVGGPGFVAQPVVSVELRTAAEIHTASGDPTSFAYTAWGDAPNMPPTDGRDRFGDTVTDNWPDAPLIRILIQEDLVAGGAGTDWDGKDFFLESVLHEFGHATMMLLAFIYGDAYVIENVCYLFGKPTSQWNNPALPWGDRVVEGAAELFKDIVFPHRRYTNRTSLRMPQSKFEDWRYLFIQLPESPYWDLGNTDALNTHEDGFFNNLGSTSYITGRKQALIFAVHEESFPGAFGLSFLSHAGKRNLHWPLNGVITLNYNFDPTGSDADPGAGSRWGDVDGFGLPVFNFNTEAGLSGQPGNRVRWGLDVDFRSLDNTVALGSIRFPIWPPVGDPDPTHYIAPISGSFVVDPADIVFVPGVSELPAEGFTMRVGVMSASDTTQPKYTLYPSDSGGFPWGRSLMWPWLEYSAQRVAFTRDVPWPYVVTPTGTLRIGPAAHGRVILPHRVRGRALRSH